jgi:hypothetical protein
MPGTLPSLAMRIGIATLSQQPASASSPTTQPYLERFVMR